MHTWGSALATGGPSWEHCSYTLLTIWSWHPQQCWHAQTPTLVPLSWIPCSPAEFSGVWFEPLTCFTPSLPHGHRNSYDSTHLGHFVISCWPYHALSYSMRAMPSPAVLLRSLCVRSLSNNLSEPPWSDSEYPNSRAPPHGCWDPCFKLPLSTASLLRCIAWILYQPVQLSPHMLGPLCSLSWPNCVQEWTWPLPAALDMPMPCLCPFVASYGNGENWHNTYL
jgi:hypothetical protein